MYCKLQVPLVMDYISIWLRAWTCQHRASNGCCVVLPTVTGHRLSSPLWVQPPFKNVVRQWAGCTSGTLAILLLQASAGKYKQHCHLTSNMVAVAVHDQLHHCRQQHACILVVALTNSLQACTWSLSDGMERLTTVRICSGHYNTHNRGAPLRRTQLSIPVNRVFGTQCDASYDPGPCRAPRKSTGAQVPELRGMPQGCTCKCGGHAAHWTPLGGHRGT